MFSERTRSRPEDIVENVDRIESYLEGLDLEGFRSQAMIGDAVERCLARITEAVIQIGEEDVLRAGLEVPWSEVKALGNRLRHEYRRIDLKRIYETARDDLPGLRAAAARALES